MIGFTLLFNVLGKIYIIVSGGIGKRMDDFKKMIFYRLKD